MKFKEKLFHLVYAFERGLKFKSSIVQSRTYADEYAIFTFDTNG